MSKFKEGDKVIFKPGYTARQIERIYKRNQMVAHDETYQEFARGVEFEVMSVYRTGRLRLKTQRGTNCEALDEYLEHVNQELHGEEL